MYVEKEIPADPTARPHAVWCGLLGYGVPPLWPSGSRYAKEPSG